MGTRGGALPKTFAAFGDGGSADWGFPLSALAFRPLFGVSPASPWSRRSIRTKKSTQTIPFELSPDPADTVRMGAPPAAGSDLPHSECHESSLPFGGFYPSVRAALMLALTLALVPALAIIVWTGVEHGSHLKEHAQQEALRQADGFAEIQTRITEAAEQSLATIAALPGIRGGELSHAASIITSSHGANPSYLNITLTDAQGTVVASSRLASGINLSQRPHIRRALEERRFAPGEYFLNLLDATPSFAYSRPVFGLDDSLRGTLSVSVKLDTYGPLFDRLSLPDDSFFGLVDRNGIRLYFHPPKKTNPIGKPIKESVWNSIKGKTVSGDFIDVGSDRVSRFYAYRPLLLPESNEPYMYVVYGVPNRTMTKLTENILARNLILMAAVALFAFASAFLLSERLFGKRLACIIATTARIASGDLAARCSVEEDRSDLGRIAGAVNAMAGTIQRRDAEKAAYADSLASSLAEKDILLKEVHHRVKNNLQMIMSLIRLQEDSAEDRKTFGENLGNRVASMAMVHEMLYKSDDMGSVDLGEYAGRLLELLQESQSARVEVVSELDSVPGDIDRAISFGLLLNELVLNAYKHAYRDGRAGTLSVSLKAAGNSARFEVVDDGPGLPENFSASASQGLGMRLAEALADQLGGTLEWANAGPGARFSVAFPLIAQS